MESLNKIGAGLAVTTALGLGAYYGAEPVAKSFIDEPAAVQPIAEPPKPKKTVAKRAPIVLTIAVDHTRSAIAKELPGVRQATKDFLQKGGILQAGDTVNICQVDEHASCTSHELPQDQAALIQAVDQIDVVQQRGVNTHLAVSIEDILSRTKGSTNGIIALWTDGIEEGENPNPEVHSPLKIIVPKKSYLPNAEKVKDSLTDPDNKEITTTTASTGDELAGILKEFTGLLGQKAQAEADGKANTAHQKAMEDYAKKVAELHRKHSQELAEYDGKIKGIEERIESIKFKVRMTLLILMLITATGMGTLIYKENKPKLKGQIRYKDGNGYPKIIKLPKRQGPFKARVNGQSYEFTPTRGGVKHNGQVLTKPTMIGTDIEFTP
ncbi:MAG: hypothetical protein Q8P62_05580 [Candidatus Peregrinibacteria bacterium]|nr:hypothetical protein [Candidatus Peregrinibacteria bacterium]